MVGDWTLPPPDARVDSDVVPPTVGRPRNPCAIGDPEVSTVGHRFTPPMPQPTVGTVFFAVLRSPPFSGEQTAKV